MADVLVPNTTRKILVATADNFNDEILYTRDASGNQVATKIPLFIGSTDKRIQREAAGGDEVDMFLPAIGLNITSIDLAEDRIQHNSNVIHSADGAEYTFAPFPIDYTIDVGLMAKKESELFQMIESIVPKYQKARYYPFIEFKFTDGSQIKRDIPIILTTSTIDLQEIDIGREERKIFRATLIMTIKAWIHKLVNTNGTGIIGGKDMRETIPDTSTGAKPGDTIANPNFGEYTGGISIDFENYMEARYGNLYIDYVAETGD